MRSSSPRWGTVAFSAAVDGRGLSLKIQDTEIGMSAEEIRLALEPFRQVDNGISKRFEGAGLGLPLALQMTKGHGN
jgi:two-component system, cell cycle sensor histidine kinase PleC